VSRRDAGALALAVLAALGGLAQTLGVEQTIAPVICGGGLLDVLAAGALGPMDVLWQTASAWLLMLIVTTPLLLIAPVRYLWDCCFADRRALMISLFAVGYVAVWMGACVPMLLASQAIKGGLFGPVVIVSVLVVVWQVSPAKQACLNRCHRRPSLAAFGVAAARDAVTYGARIGAWCVGACWPLMLVPLVLERNGSGVMAVVALFLAAERLEPPAPIAWRLRVPMRAVQMTTAKLRAPAGGLRTDGLTANS
jgi:predicted metal-binding membrane protein